MGNANVICVLGMHRSGTSCLAGSLEEAGVYLGDVARRGRHNAKGNRESSAVMDLHNRILGHSGGGWDRPPASVVWTDAHCAEREAIIQSFGDRPVWGFKDPRTVLMVDFWTSALPGMKFVGTVRHPLLVSESLAARGGGSSEYWVELWAQYNRKLLEVYNRAPFPIVRFDLDPALYRRSLDIAFRRLDLGCEHPTFFDPELRHRELPPNDMLPGPVARLYDALCDAAIDPSAPD